MPNIESDELQIHSDNVLVRVAAGEHYTITQDGRPVAELSPVARRPRWVSREYFVHHILSHQADHQLAGDLKRMLVDPS